MSCAIKTTLDLACTMAISAEITTKKAINARIRTIFFLSERPFFVAGAIRSRVMVELEVSTKEERVDIDAERTRTSTMPMRIGERFANMDGTMLS